jgi:probable addiction module antidote protein
MRFPKFEESLLRELENPEFLIHYLADAVEENDVEGFLLAVRDVIEARGGMGKFSKKIKTMHRVSLYKALSKNGNPLFATMLEILDSLGIGLMPYIKEKRTGQARRA